MKPTVAVVDLIVAYLDYEYSCCGEVLKKKKGSSVVETVCFSQLSVLNTNTFLFRFILFIFLHFYYTINLYMHTCRAPD